MKPAAILLLCPMLALSEIATEYIPGSSCGLANPISVVVDRDPTEAERSAGCVYVRKTVRDPLPSGIICGYSWANF